MTEVATTVGSIAGEVYLDLTRLIRDVDEAKAKLRELEGEHTAFTIDVDNRKALDAIDEVEERGEELEAAPAKVRIEIDAAGAEAKLEEVRAAAAKPIVQDVVIRTETAGGFADGTLRPTVMGAAPQSGQMAAEQLLGANGDLVASYKGVEEEVVRVGMAFTTEEENALSVAVAKHQLAAANKAATAAEQAFVKVLQDEKAPADALAAAEQKALTARHLATQAAGELTTVSAELGKTEEVVADSADSAADGLDKAAKSANGAEGRFQALKLVILGLGPGLVPLAAGAVGITGALGGLGAAGVLAFLGIKREIAEGTDAGVEYSSMLARLKADAHELESTAAGGLLSGASTASAELQAAMPTLNREVGTFAGELGQILPTGLDAVVTMLERAEPLLDAGGQYLVRFVQGLDGFSHSSDFESFIRTAVDDLPLVETTIGDTLTFVERFLSAMGPYGNAVLTIVDDALKLGSVLSPLAPGIWAMVTALTALKLGSAALPIVQGLFAGLGATAATTAAEIGAVAVAEDVATDGVDLIPQAAAAGGATSLLAAAGIGVGVEGLSLASSQGAGKTRPGTSASSVDTSYTGFGAGTAKSKGPSTGTSGGDTSYSGFGAGVTSSANTEAAALITVAQAYQQVAAAAAKAASKEADASKRNESLVSTGDAVDTAFTGLAKALDRSNLTLDGSSAAAVKNREAILGSVQAIQAHADSINSDGKHAAQAAIYTDTFALSLERSLVKLGLSKTAADEYIKKLLGIPKGTTLQVSLIDAKAMAYLESIKSTMNNLNGTTAKVYVEAIASGVSAGRAAQIAKNSGYASGGTIGLADGGTGYTGTVSGPGNAAADLAGRYALANGEEVTGNKYGQASTFRPVLKAINGQQVRTMDDLAAMLGGGRRGAVTTKTVHVGGVHLHNPVAKDPVQSAEDASQLIGAYADFPG